MNDITYAVSVDVNNPIIPYNVYVASVLDSNVRYLEITLYENGNIITLSNTATATASLVTDNVLVDGNVNCTISDNIITVPLEDLQRHGNLDVQVTVTEGTKVLAIPFPIQVRVTPNIAENAQIDENSLGSYAEVVHEITEAHGAYTTLHDAISAKLDNADGSVKENNIADESITVEKVADDLAAVINGKEVKDNKKTTLTGNESSNDFYPTTKAVADALNTKADSSALTAKADVTYVDDRLNTKADVTYVDGGVWDITGNEPIALDNKNSYIITSGTTADISGFVTDNYYDCAVVACSEGESFLVATRGQNGPRPWAFVSSDGTVLQREDAQKNLKQYKRIVAPANSAYLIINNYRLDSVGKAYKGQGFLAGVAYVDDAIKSSAIYPYLRSKKGIILGDSISYGLYSFWDGTQRKNSDGLNPDYASVRISDHFANLAGMTVTNIAKRGTGYVADSRHLGNALVKAGATDFSQYDFVGLCFGINDYIQNKALGTLQADEEGTVVGNLSRVLKKIYGDNPLAKVVIFSPYNAWGQVAVNQDVNILYGDESTNYALGYANNAGYTLQQLVDAIDAVADHYGVTHERLNKSNVVNRINIKDIMIDGLHPSLEAMPMLAAEMFAQKDFG